MNINGLNSPAKTQILSIWVKNKPSYMWLIKYTQSIKSLKKKLEKVILSKP